MFTRKIFGYGLCTVILALAFIACESPNDEPAHVHNYEWTVSAPATCIATGTEAGVCTLDPSHTTTREIPIDLVDGHDWGEWEGTVTCTEAGTGTRVCSRSEEHIEEDDNLQALGHNYTYEETTDPTCTTEGVETGTCTHDQTHTTTRAIAIDPTAHNWNNSYTVTTHATCSATGIETDTCAYNEEHTRTQTIAINANAHSWGAWVETLAATEDDDGEEMRTCAHNATHVETNALAALKHEHVWGEWEVINPATCTEKGERERVCQINSSHKDYEDIDPLGHDEGAWHITLAATCTATGTKQLRCERDNFVLETETIAALGHDSGAWHVILAATCTATGTKELRCTIDNAVLETGTIAIDPNAHDSGAWHVTLAATCTATGTRELRCSRDNAVLETDTIAALGHDWGNWAQTTAPTATEDGEETRMCQRDNAHETRAIAKYLYIITGSGTSFTAARGSATVGTANQPIQTVITAIRTNANGNGIAIQFGDGESTLDIGAASVEFNATGGTWGLITLSGKITSENTIATEGTVMTANAVSINSTADIANTAEVDGGRAVYHNSAGAITISGGTVSAVKGVAVYHNSAGLITVSGDAVVTSASATIVGTIYCASLSGSVSAVRLAITGGTVTNTNFVVGSTNVSGYAVHIRDGAVATISGGTVSSGSIVVTAVNNHGQLTISGGTVSGSSNTPAVSNSRTLTISGNALITSGNFAGSMYYIGTINNSSSYGTLTISGGRVENTSGRAIFNNSGKVTISGDAVVTSSDSGAGQRGTIFSMGGSITVLGGTVENTNSGGSGNNANAIYFYTGDHPNATIATVTLGGDPAITGPIYWENWQSGSQGGTYPALVTLDSTFAPTAGRVYMLSKQRDSSDYPIAVRDGAQFQSNFAHAANGGQFPISGNNLAWANY